MRPRPSSALLLSAAIGHAWLLLSCGGGGGNPNPITPTPVVPSVSAVSPNAGTTLGGTVITVTGANFAAGATVTVGGAAATNVVVSSATMGPDAARALAESARDRQLLFLDAPVSGGAVKARAGLKKQYR